MPSYNLPPMWSRVVDLVNVFWAWDVFKALILIPVAYFIAPIAFRVFSIGVAGLLDGDVPFSSVMYGRGGFRSGGLIHSGRGSHRIAGYRWFDDVPWDMEERDYDEDPFGGWASDSSPEEEFWTVPEDYGLLARVEDDDGESASAGGGSSSDLPMRLSYDSWKDS